MDLQTHESASAKRRQPSGKVKPNVSEITSSEQRTLPEDSTISRRQIEAAEKVQSLGSIIWEKFLVHRMAVAGLFVIIAFIVIALLAPAIGHFTKLDPMAQNALHRYLPPFSTTTASSSQREIAIERFILMYPELSTALQNEAIEKQLVTPVRPEDALYDLAQKTGDDLTKAVKELKVDGASSFRDLVSNFETYHVFGTDELGRDVFIRLVYGARVSIGVGIMVALVSAFIGLLIGSVAGYYGGWIDVLLMRFTDSLLSLPQLPVLIVVSAVSIEKLTEAVPFLGYIANPSNESIVKLVFILVLFSWMQVARLVRASVLSLKEREFILAAKTLGATDRKIIFRHLFPNTIAPLLVSVTLGVGSSIQTEAALSFLGLGIQQPTPSWGNMMFNALEIMLDSPFLVMIPGFLILMTTISFNYLGDGLQDAIDPKTLRK
ncbi:MAG: ABC transporter permease subunit [Bdellovibrionaceae bacterium]|nr:ABC transporter permease subunit [Pseudobdellovibrionaceae bacterium]